MGQVKVQSYRNPLIRLGPTILIFGILFICTMDHPFFWDTISQASKTADWFYQHDFESLLLPTELDTGHPPFFGIYLALWWELFGRTLTVSHLAVLPFILGIIWQAWRLVSYFFEPKYRPWVVLIVLTDATLMAQTTLVSPDLVLVFCFIWGVNSLLKREYYHFIAASAIMPLISIRGMLGLAALLLLDLLLHWIRTRKFESWNELFRRERFRIVPQNWTVLLKYLPALIMLFSYLTYHYLETGWWVFTPSDQWSQHRTLSGWKSILWNVGITGWRFLDFGRFVYWILIAWLSWKIYVSKATWNQRDLELTTLPLTYIAVFLPVFSLIQNPISHRYFIPAFLFIALWVLYWLFRLYRFNRWTKMILIVAIAIQISGNCWIYPKHIAQAWDCSLAYLPYFELREDMLHHIREENIPLHQIGTVFPNVGPLDNIDLSERQEGMVKKNFNTNEYIFYSNIMNDFSDEELEMLNNTWSLTQAYRQCGIEVILYKQPD